MVDVAQLVRVPDCGSEGRGFESLLPPTKKRQTIVSFFVSLYFYGLVLHTTYRHSCCIVAIVTVHSETVHTYATIIRESVTIFG